MSKVLRFPKKNLKKRGKSDRRLPFFFYLMAILLAVIGGRLVFIQAVEAEKFSRLARSQRLTQVELASNRGAIYDRNGEIMAISVDMDTVFATPYQVTKPRKAAGKLARLLRGDENEIYNKLTADTGFAYIKRKVNRKVSKNIKRLKLDGIGLAPESKRFYPGKSLASHAIGFVGMDNNGLSGIELSYDSYLRGRPGRLEMEQDLYGRPIPGGHFKLTKPSDGRNLVLTIDKEIQYKAQVELKKAVKRWQAAAGWIIVMDSRTGEIYALANQPTFDLNKFYKTEADRLKNRAVSDVYEPGSTMKIITAAAALEERLFSANQSFALPGTIKVGGYTIGEAHARGTEQFTFSQIVTRSSNVGAVTIGMALGKERLYKYIRRFGLGLPVDSGMPGQGQGYVPEPGLWSASTIGNVPFGQGLSSTALEMIRAVNVVASGGRLIQPRIVKQIVDINEKGKAIKMKVEPPSQAISQPTAVTMSRILREAVEEGTGGSAKIPGYEAAGKTGTAQKSKQGARGYDPGKYVSTFIGFAPVSEPALTILVALDEPKEMIYGGVVAAPAFSAVGEFALQRLKITP